MTEKAGDVFADSSATVTIYVKENKTVSKGDIEKLFTSNNKKWKVINFKKEVRSKPVATYKVNFKGGT